MFENILFDLDGTLIDSSQDVRGALNRVLVKHGCFEIDSEYIYPLLKEGVQNTLKIGFAKSNKTITENEIDDLVKEYLAYYQAEPISRTKIYPDTIETLTYLKSKDIKLGICTNKPSMITHLVLEKLNLTGFFDAVVAAEDTPLIKPDAEHIYITLDRMGIKKTVSAVMIGDSGTDIYAARNAHIPVIAVNYGYSGKEIQKYHADEYIDDMKSLPNALIKLFDRIIINNESVRLSAAKDQQTRQVTTL